MNRITLCFIPDSDLYRKKKTHYAREKLDVSQENSFENALFTLTDNYLLYFSRFGIQTRESVEYETSQRPQGGISGEFVIPPIMPSSRRAYIFLGNLRQLKKLAAFWKWLVKEEKFDV